MDAQRSARRGRVAGRAGIESVRRPAVVGRRSSVVGRTLQEKVREVIDAEVHLVVLSRVSQRHGHDPGVAHQDVQRDAGVFERLGVVRHGGEVRHLEPRGWQDVDRGAGDFLEDRRARDVRLLDGPAREDDALASRRELLRGGEADAAVRAGDEDGASRGGGRRRRDDDVVVRERERDARGR
eukprot:31231-Pelagococcus_subviridis.AAC.15